MKLRNILAKPKDDFVIPSFYEAFQKHGLQEGEDPNPLHYNSHRNRIYDSICRDIKLLKASEDKNVKAYTHVVRMVTSTGREFENHVEINDMAWLFAERIPNDFPHKLLNLMLSKNDDSLSYKDYIVLMYALYQEKLMKENLSDFPVSFLCDMYTPLANEIKKKYTR
jgi:hypothetical protein